MPIVRLGRSLKKKDLNTVNDVVVDTSNNDENVDDETESVISTTSNVSVSNLINQRSSNFMSMLNNKLKPENKFVNGVSDEHTITAETSGVLQIDVNVDFEYIPFYSFVSSGNLICSMNSYDKNSLFINVDNMTSEDITLTVNYILFKK